jgi:hypothetical protein
MAPFHGGDHDPSTSQVSPQDANSSQMHVPSLEKPIEPKEKIPILPTSQTTESRGSIMTSRPGRPLPTRAASRTTQPATQNGGTSQNQANRGRSRKPSQSSLGLQLEPVQEISIPHQYRSSDVDELSDMVSRMRTLSQGNVSVAFRWGLNRC